MKKLFVFILPFIILIGGFAQEKGNGKVKKSKDKEYKHSIKSDDRHNKDGDDDIQIFGRSKEKDSYKPNDDSRNKDDDYNKHGKKYSKNQPAKVRAAFYNDYPNAKNVRWTKNQGNWTATFNSGGLFNRRMKVTYHANGERIDAFTTRNVHRKRP